MKLILVLLLVFAVSTIEAGKGGKGKGRGGHRSGEKGGDDHKSHEPVDPAVLATDCQEEFDSVKSCVNGVLSGIEEERAAKKEAFKAAKVACLTDNNCAAPESSAESGEKSSNREARRACVKALFDSDVKENLQSCVQESVTDFVFPEDFLEKHGGKKRGGRGRRGGFKHGGKKGFSLGAMCDKREKILSGCADEDSKTAAETCIGALYKEKYGGGHGKGKHSHSKEKKGGVGDAMKQCWGSLSDNCKAKKHAIKDALCDCAMQQLDDDELIEKIHQCHEDNHDDDDEEDEEDDAKHADMIKKRLGQLFCMRHGHGKKDGHGHGDHDHKSGEGSSSSEEGDDDGED